MQGDPKAASLVEVPGFVRDLLDLFREWEQAQGTSFQDFKAIWARRSLSYLHFARYDKFSRAKWVQVLCSAAYAYLLVNSHRANIGSIYCIYLIWSTQPIKCKWKKPPKPKQPIQISLALWGKIKTILEMPITTSGVPDCIAIYRRIREDACGFQFSLTVEVLPPPHLWPTSDTNLPIELLYCDSLVGVDIEPLKALTRKYVDASSTYLSAPKDYDIDLAEHIEALMDAARKPASEDVVSSPDPYPSIPTPNPQNVRDDTRDAVESMVEEPLEDDDDEDEDGDGEEYEDYDPW
eukprot:TRINITY_DN7522_c0_g1_i1.p1 TRINITY_DN7522_c0_g1~~TRINITY_DN7522_c0_g1_i1.p1  ORF type:complete len:310 (-),score=49.19 TRINITY_DN7522_c0_g1_i1:38-916(-)